MKKFFAVIMSIAMILCLGACANQNNGSGGPDIPVDKTLTQGTPAGFDTNKFDKTCDTVIQYINSGSYESMTGLVKEECKSKLTADYFKETCEPILKDAGKDGEVNGVNYYKSGSSSGDEKNCIADILVKYSKSEVTYRITVDKDCNLIDFVVK